MANVTIALNGDIRRRIVPSPKGGVKESRVHINGDPQDSTPTIAGPPQRQKVATKASHKRARAKAKVDPTLSATAVLSGAT